MQEAPSPLPTKASIDQAILDSIIARRMRPGTRLGESELAKLFGVSRTLVREAMMRLEVRHIVEVRPRKGWYVVEPAAKEVGPVFQARRILETSILRALPRQTAATLAPVHAHLDQERAAIAAGDHARLVCLMGDFHIRLVDLLANPILAEITRDLTARTVLISMLYQSDEHAHESHVGHCRIVEALQRGDNAGASDLAVRHLDEVEAGLKLDVVADPLTNLRGILASEDSLRSRH